MSDEIPLPDFKDGPTINKPFRDIFLPNIDQEIVEDLAHTMMVEYNREKAMWEWSQDAVDFACLLRRKCFEKNNQENSDE